MSMIVLDESKLHQLVTELQNKKNPPRENYRYVIHSVVGMNPQMNLSLPYPERNREISESMKCAILSESVLEREWISEEEDKAWGDL